MKKLFFFLAAIAVAFTANAKVIQGTPNPGEQGRVNWWVNGEAQAQPGDTIILADGEYEESSSFELNKAGLVIMAAEGAKPVIKITNTWASLKLMATTTFDGITFDGTGTTNYPILSSGTTAGSVFTFKNCEFKNYAYYAISNPYEGGTVVDSIIINNCIFHDGGSAVYMNRKGLDGNHACKYFKMTNSTLYNITGQGRAAIDVSANGDATGMQNTVEIDHITLYNFTTSEYGGIAIRKTSDLQITNSIIANPTAGLTAIYHYCKVGKNLLYNVTLKTSDGAAHDEATITTDPKFVDATNGNFALAEGSPALGAATDGSNLGDPRWNVVAEPEPTTETVYFIDVKKWGKVNAYAWNTNGNNGWPGAAATKETEQIAGYDVYSFTANAGQYANVIFNNKVGDTGSQTEDLVWTAGKYYWMGVAKNFAGATKEEAEATLAAPLPDAWNIVGDAGLMGKGWDLNAAENAMTLQADGTYLLEKKDITITAGSYEYKAAKDHGWDVSVPAGSSNQKLTISKSGIYDVTFVLDVTAKKLTATATLKKEAVVIPTVIIAGDMNSWNQTKDKFTMAADSLTATFKATLTAKSYAFKMIVGGAWLSDGKTITRAANSTKFTGANSSTNSTLKADIAGEYLFTWEYATKTLTVTYPELPVEYTVTATVNPAETGTVAGAGKYEEGKTATLTATAAEGYEFVNWTVGEEVVSTENPYTFAVTADAALVANFKEVVVEPTYDWDVEAKDLSVNANEVMTQIEGSNSFNPDMMISVTLFATGYGKYTSAGTDNDQFNAYYMGYPILGELTYSYSEELKSDLVVIIGTMTDEENITSTVRITMYEEYLEPTDVVVLNNLSKTVQGRGPWASLMLFNAANDTIISLSGCDGTYGKYSAFGTFGELELEGKGEWKNDGENDVFVGVLYNADKTKVFQVTASTPAEAAPEAKEYRFEVSNIDFFIDLEGDFYIYCASEEDAEVPFNLELILYGWKGAGNYGIGEMAGTIYTVDYMDGAAVANMNSEIEVIVEDGKVIIIGQVEDADGNIYNLSLEGAEPQVDDDDPTTGVENLNGTVAPVKVIENGQIFIIRNGVKYNAQGAKL